MASEQERKELDDRARRGETVVPGGKGGKSYKAQQQLAEGRSRGGQMRREQVGTEGFQEMGRKGGLSSGKRSGDQRSKTGEREGVVEGIDVDESTG
ncbi:hypothetical protein L1887_16665 [Cichorium endivia]|nr:hypothetical protein L1887_16665 [Cichorium endivia]